MRARSSRHFSRVIPSPGLPGRQGRHESKPCCRGNSEQLPSVRAEPVEAPVDALFTLRQVQGEWSQSEVPSVLYKPQSDAHARSKGVPQGMMWRFRFQNETPIRSPYSSVLFLGSTKPCTISDLEIFQYRKKGSAKTSTEWRFFSTLAPSLHPYPLF